MKDLRLQITNKPKTKTKQTGRNRKEPNVDVLEVGTETKVYRKRHTQTEINVPVGEMFVQ